MGLSGEGLLWAGASGKALYLLLSIAGDPKAVPELKSSLKTILTVKLPRGWGFSANHLMSAWLGALNQNT